LRPNFNRVAGQVQGLVRMVEKDRCCIDILTQLQSVRSCQIDQRQMVQRQIDQRQIDQRLSDTKRSVRGRRGRARPKRSVGISGSPFAGS